MTQPLASVLVSSDQLTSIMELYQHGQCLQAYRLTEAIGPLKYWTGTDAQLLGGRLAIHLGAPRLTYRLHLMAWRQNRTHPEACYYHARALQDRRGSLTAWRFLKHIGELPQEAPVSVRSDWLAFHGCVLGRFRDFDAAETYLRRAEELCPNQPWTCMERAFVLEMEDRYEESLAASRRALELRPWYRPAVQAVAHTLQLLDRDREALEFLHEAAQRIESGLILAQLAALQSELGQHRDAQQSYARFAELSPLMEKSIAEWLAARRSDTAYYLGEYAQAAEFARQAKNPFHEKIAEHLTATPTEGKRVLLEVGFVRQHHQTCAPAVLASLSRFWKMPADHLDVAAAICYDGTPDHRERAWAEEHGWHCREFAVTWDSARALIDRGVPFT